MIISYDVIYVASSSTTVTSSLSFSFSITTLSSYIYTLYISIPIISTVSPSFNILYFIIPPIFLIYHDL